jgi:hypothetical protein
MLRFPSSALASLAVVCAAHSALAAPSGPPDTSNDRSHALVVPPSVLREGDPFRQLDEVLPTPNDQRTASGAPGARYWQQQVDHDMAVTLDPTTTELVGSARITYHNNSPDELRYLWFQLEQNRFRHDSLGARAQVAPDLSRPTPIASFRQIVEQHEWEGGYRDISVTMPGGAPIPFIVVDTMMRIDLPAPLAPGARVEFDIGWRFFVVKNTTARARSNYELLGENDPTRSDADLAPLYVMAQFFPRAAPYTDVRGWHHKPFLGTGEFALEFGNYTLAVTVPDTWTVAATGDLINGDDVLNGEQRARLDAARNNETPQFVTTPEEAAARREAKPTGTKTWRFRAENVRDVAFAASASFIWDAAKAPIPGTDRACLAMSFYPAEGEPLWSRYSTHAVAHAIDCFSRYAVPYPYPVAISVNGPVGGMEYPMITFNGPRPERDGTYSAGTKWGLVSVIIHEVGHFWYPMIINSDERQWTWMDEGLTTFGQYLAEQEWQRKYPSGRGEPERIIEYMTSAEQEPIVTNSESVRRLGPNAYAKPATALNVLRETVLGRELFDFALREYSRRWAFKRPEPADFFRSMEDASGVDLDWFWRGWFYSTRAVDIAVTGVTRYTLETGDPERVKSAKKADRDARPKTLSEERNESLAVRADRYPELLDFYSTFDELEVTEQDRRRFRDLVARLGARDAALLDTTLSFTIVRFENKDGIPSPLPLTVTFSDGTTEDITLPAEIWRYAGGVRASKLFVTEKEIARVEFDRRRQTADRDPSDNAFPQEIRREWFAVEPRDRGSNPMRDAVDSAKRTETRTMAEALATRIAEAIRAGRSAGSALGAEPPNDAWGVAFVVLDGAEQGSGGVAQIISAGPDRAIGGDDDIAYVVTGDGALRDSPRIPARAEPRR